MVLCSVLMRGQILKHHYICIIFVLYVCTMHHIVHCLKLYKGANIHFSYIHLYVLADTLLCFTSCAGSVSLHAQVLTSVEVVVVVEDCALSLLSVSVQNDSQSNAATLQVQVEFKLPVSLEYDTLSLLIKPHVPGETNSDKSKSSQKGSYRLVSLLLVD